MKKALFICSTALSATILASCGPYKQQKYVNIGTNETAFMIPMEQATSNGQKMLKSVDFLEQKKVSAKRVYIEQKQISTGRMGWDYDWIPTDTVVIVHRAPVTREWAGNTGLNVESRESIGFNIPVNSTASVLEEDASTFLYHFGGQDIGYVMDHNVRPFILDLLTIEFGKLSLDECQSKRNDVYDTMKVRTIKFFKAYGLTIINLGVAGEFTYTDGKIQEAINNKFTSEMKITAAQNEADAANKFAVAAESIKKQKELDADVNLKNALATALANGKITLPSTLVLGKDASIFDLFVMKTLNTQANSQK